MKVAIISGSVRKGRMSTHVTRWVEEAATKLGRDDVTFEVVPLADYDLPAYEDVPPAMLEEHSTDAARAWTSKIAEFDAYVLVTPEYNHGVPGALKNAVDFLSNEWRSKVIAFVSYGADGGVRAVEQWRQIVANFDLIDIRATVSLGLFTDFDGQGIAPLQRRVGEIENTLNSLIATTQRWGK